ncbi:MAG: histidine kinase [Bacillota bacterium]|jgi:signal transduction histidine kinase
MSVVSAGYVGISFITAIIISSLAVSAWHSRPTCGAMPFTLMMLAITQLIMGRMLFFISAAAIAKNFWLNYSSIFGLIYAGAWLLMTLQIARVKRRTRRRVTGGLVFLLLIYGCLMSANYQGWFKVSPLVEAVSALIIAGGVFGLYFFDIMALAQATVTRNMGDGLLVVDNHGHIVDANPSAQAILDLADRDFIDNRIREVCRLWPCGGEITDGEAQTEEWVLSNGAQPRYFLIQVIPLFNRWKSMLGKAVVLQDITLQKELQAQKVEDQKALLILQERKRLRREIHDGTGQIWSYVNLQIEAARALVARNDLQQADQMLEKTADIIRGAHGQVRESITGLQVTSETHLSFSKQVAEYLKWYSQNWGIQTELVVVNNPADDLFSPHAQLQLLRIIQEALTNARKHAQAKLVRVTFRIGNQMAEIVIADDGCGFDPEQKATQLGYGLKIMEERAAEVGCRLQIKTALHAGTKVIIEIPFVEEGDGDDESTDC